MQYTLRKIPAILDQELRRRACQEEKNLNQVAMEALVRSAGLSQVPTRNRDLADIAGQWREDPEFDQALASQDRVAEEMWR